MSWQHEQRSTFEHDVFEELIQSNVFPEYQNVHELIIRENYCF